MYNWMYTRLRSSTSSFVDEMSPQRNGWWRTVPTTKWLVTNCTHDETAATKRRRQNGSNEKAATNGGDKRGCTHQLRRTQLLTQSLAHSRKHLYLYRWKRKNEGENLKAIFSNEYCPGKNWNHTHHRMNMWFALVLGINMLLFGCRVVERHLDSLKLSLHDCKSWSMLQLKEGKQQ